MDFFKKLHAQSAYKAEYDKRKETTITWTGPNKFDKSSKLHKGWLLFLISVTEMFTLPPSSHHHPPV